MDAQQADRALPAWPDGPGTYLLLLRLSESAMIETGSRRRFRLPAGWYVYVGSALGGLRARLRRHARRSKPRHWHVDALRARADLVAVVYRESRERLECATAARLATLPGASVPVPGFGASDCRCRSHLFFFEQRPGLRLGPSWTVTPVETAQSKTVCEYGATSTKASMTLGPSRLSPHSMAASNSAALRAGRQGTPK